MKRSVLGKGLLCVVALLLAMSMVLCACGGQTDTTTEPSANRSGNSDPVSGEVVTADPTNDQEPADDETNAQVDATEGTAERQDADEETLPPFLLEPTGTIPDYDDLNKYLLDEDWD